MRLEIITIFPELFESFLNSSLIKRAREAGLATITTRNIRDFANPPHFHVDDAPYGGGAGMVLKPEPLALAIEAAKKKLPNARVVLLTPAGLPYTQLKAHEYAQLEELILVCGRYEGVDQRVIDLLVDEEISIGDYVLMGGEIPAMAVIESCLRLVENVVGNSESLHEESFSIGSEKEAILEAPHFTRPAEFRGRSVPEVLLSGNHEKIKCWRRESSILRTRERRPDLIDK